MAEEVKRLLFHCRRGWGGLIRWGLLYC